MIVGRVQHGQLQIIDRIRDPVRLAAGLTDDKTLRPEVAQRALDCLQRFGQRIRDIEPENIRAVGTNTLRMAQSANGFLDAGQEALGNHIEIISGIEEARLIHLGVTHSLPEPEGRRLVVDIGGGSTEVIIGERSSPLRLESLHMGCVNMSQRFFADGKINKRKMKKAILAAQLELQPINRSYLKLGWSMSAGSSGTIRTIRDIVHEAGWSDNGITAKSLEKLREHLIDAGQTDKLSFNSLSEDRAAVLAGGVAILCGVFKSLDINRMLFSSGALREGLLYDLLGRLQHQDIRESTIRTLAKRYHVDSNQAERVKTTALSLLKQATSGWQLDLEQASRWLHWAALVHEIGLVIAHSQYQKHGAYLIEHSDLPGFSLRDQNFLSVMIRCHRRKLRKDIVRELPSNIHTIAMRLSLLLRISVLLHRSRSENSLDDPVLRVKKQSIHLQFADGWLDNNSLTRADLDTEKQYLDAAGFELHYS